VLHAFYADLLGSPVVATLPADAPRVLLHISGLNAMEAHFTAFESNTML
jgi:hypothetical protein